jgi:hypothetical protein
MSDCIIPTLNSNSTSEHSNSILVLPITELHRATIYTEIITSTTGEIMFRSTSRLVKDYMNNPDYDKDNRIDFNSLKIKIEYNKINNPLVLIVPTHITTLIGRIPVQHGINLQKKIIDGRNDLLSGKIKIENTCFGKKNSNVQYRNTIQNNNHLSSNYLSNNYPKTNSYYRDGIKYKSSKQGSKYITLSLKGDKKEKFLSKHRKHLIIKKKY